MKKKDVLRLLADLPDEFDASQFLYTLTLKHELERAEADFAAGRLTSRPDEAPTLWEHQRARHRHAERVLARLYNNEELIAQAVAGFEASERGERGTPFREVLEAARRREGED